MTIVTHIVTTATIVSVSVPKNSIDPQTIIALSILINCLIDLDHIYAVLKQPQFFLQEGTKQIWHKARTSFHELFGVMLWSSIALLVSLFNVTLGLCIGLIAITHLAEDFIIGRSYPFAPFKNDEMFLFQLRTRQKVIFETSLILLSIFVWIISHQ